MASTAHALFCFEVLAASLEKRDGLSLRQIEDLWIQYESQTQSAKPPIEDVVQDGSEDNADDAEMTEDEGEDDEDDENDEEDNEGVTKPMPSTLRPTSISRLQAPSPASASTSSTPSTLSTTSSQSALGDTSKSSSKSSFFSFGRGSPATLASKDEEYPLFVTWNTINWRGYKSLRGCIGTFDPHELASGLKSYALTS